MLVCVSRLSLIHRSIILRIISGVRSPLAAAAALAVSSLTGSSTVSAPSAAGAAPCSAGVASGAWLSSFFTVMFSTAPVLSSSSWTRAAAAKHKRATLKGYGYKHMGLISYWRQSLFAFTVKY